MTTAFVDTSHAANKVTRRSHLGHILFAGKAPAEWHSERQTAVEASASSFKFIATKHCTEDIKCLGFKLRMFEMPLDENKPETRILRADEAIVMNLPLAGDILPMPIILQDGVLLLKFVQLGGS